MKRRCFFAYFELTIPLIKRHAKEYKHGYQAVMRGFINENSTD